METIKEDENQESVSSTTSTMQETLSAGDIALVTAAVNSQASTSSSRTSNDRSQPSLELTPPCAVNLEKGGWFSMKTTTPNSDELSILTPESVHFIATSDSELGHEVEMGLISDSLIPSYKIDILDKTLNDEGVEKWSLPYDALELKYMWLMVPRLTVWLLSWSMYGMLRR